MVVVDSEGLVNLVHNPQEHAVVELTSQSITGGGGLSWVLGDLNHALTGGTLWADDGLGQVLWVHAQQLGGLVQWRSIDDGSLILGISLELDVT